MENKKTTSIIFAIIAIILGFTLYKQFDFQTLKFEKAGIGTCLCYSIFSPAFFILARNAKKEIITTITLT